MLRRTWTSPISKVGQDRDPPVAMKEDPPQYPRDREIPRTRSVADRFEELLTRNTTDLCYKTRNHMSIEPRNEQQMLQQFWKREPTHNLNALMRKLYKELVAAP